MRLVEEISKTRGAKYCSVDSAEEFKRIMNQVQSQLASNQFVLHCVVACTVSGV